MVIAKELMFSKIKFKIKIKGGVDQFMMEIMDSMIN
jgi:hypothetical protein